MKTLTKVALSALSLASVAAISVAGTVAFLTDDEKANNVFTVGNVDIEIVEQQRTEDGKALEDFEPGKELTPVVGSAQSTKDQWGMPVIDNYVDKIVTVENTGKSDAYIRIYVATPAALVNTVGANMSDNPLHSNIGNRFDPSGKGTYNDGSWTTAENPYFEQFGNQWNPDVNPIQTATIDDIKYQISVYTTQVPIAPGESTAAVITGFYLDSRVDYDDETGNYTIDGVEIEYDLSQGVVIPVYAQAVQAAGFENADDAFTAAGLTADDMWASINAVIDEDEALDGDYNKTGYIPNVAGEAIDGLVVVDNTNDTTNLRALHKNYLTGDLSINNSYLDGTYAMNVTAVESENAVLTATNTAFRGWVSYSGFASATFTNCTFDANSNPEIYNTVRPYDTTEFIGCDFAGTEFWLDQLDGAKITLTDCTLNGVEITDASQLNIVYGDASSVVIG